MNDWIDVTALGKILLGGLICGAGLPAIFALGLRALHLGAPAAVPADAAAGGATANRPASAAESQRLVGGSPLGIGIAGLCFAIVLAAIGWGIYLIVAGT
jgi:hypothetical protein